MRDAHWGVMAGNSRVLPSSAPPSSVVPSVFVSGLLCDQQNMASQLTSQLTFWLLLGSPLDHSLREKSAATV